MYYNSDGEGEENTTNGGFLDISDPNTFLGGQNVHNLIIIGLLLFIIIKKRD